MPFVPSNGLYSHMVHAFGGWSEAQEVIDALGSGGGSGTVTTVSVVTANGVSGVVANPTTAPAITITLGDITPNSVAAVGTITGSNLSGTSSGTNTGDQTITLTGDVAGSGTGSFAATIGAHKVSYAKMQQASASTLLGNPTGAPADISEITLGTGLSFAGSVLNATGGGGTVTSVDMSVPSGFTISGNPITISGTLAIGLSNQSANTVWAGPLSGAASAPSFRQLNGVDLFYDTNHNMFVGGGGASISTGKSNLGIGDSFGGASALQAITSGQNNIALGSEALPLLLGGNFNIAIGEFAASKQTTGNSNVAIGISALRNWAGSSGSQANSALGSSSLFSVTSGSQNVGIGFQAGFELVTGSNNTFIGANAGTTNSTISSGIALGFNAKAANNNQAVVGGTGSDAVALIWAGSTAPADADLSTSQSSLYWDFTPTFPTLRAKGKDSGGTVFNITLGGTSTGIGITYLQAINTIDVITSTEVVLHDNPYILPSGDVIILETDSLLHVDAPDQFTDWVTSVSPNDVEIPPNCTKTVLDDPYIVTTGTVTIVDQAGLLSLAPTISLSVSKITILTTVSVSPFVPNAGTRALLVKCVGGGGGGGGVATAVTNAGAGGGGGGGGMSQTYLAGPLKVSYPFAVGGSGAGGSAGANPGLSGGTTTFDSPSVCTAVGGIGGAGDTVAAGPRVGGSGGPGGAQASGVGDHTASGGPGKTAMVLAAAQAASGDGGDSIWAGGGPGRISQGNGNNGVSNGAGGAGGCILSGGASVGGGTGGAGRIEVWELA